MPWCRPCATSSRSSTPGWIACPIRGCTKTAPTRRFLAWWGLSLYLLQLGSRRQLDYELRDGGQVLTNLNRLAETAQETLPVHDTLDHFLGHSTLGGFERLNRQLVQRLLRMKVLDAARLLGQFVVLLDGTGLICFHRRHCPYCLVQRHGKQTLYLHHVLEAKLLGPAGVVLSLGSEFIENADAGPTQGRSAQEIKQDCELKALHRLLPRIKKSYPQLRFVLAMDALQACRPVFALVQEMGWSFVVTFKEGRTPTLWREFRTLVPLCPDQYLRRDWVDRPVQEFRWVKDLSYQDSEGRWWKLNALECTETAADGPQHYFAWLTMLPVGQEDGGSDRPERRTRPLESGERRVQPPEEQRPEPGACLQYRPGEGENLLSLAADRLHPGAVVGARQPAAPARRSRGAAGGEAVRQLEEHRTPAAGEPPF